MPTHDGIAAGRSRGPALRLRDAAVHDLTRGRLRTLAWEAVSHGLYAPLDRQRSTLDHAYALRQVLPRDSGFGHLTSARLRGLWLPNRLGSHVWLATTTSSVHIQRRGIYVRRSRYAEFDDLDGVPVVSAAQTLVELARDLSLVDLVPMVDCALRAGAAPSDILAAARPRVPGANRLRRALPLADPRSESWWESVLRLLHLLTGLGPVESQVKIREDGELVARTDLHIVGTDRHPEYDGLDHRDRDRHWRDLAREKALSRLHVERYGYTSDEIVRSPGRIIRDAEDARGLPHDPRRVRTWWKWARTSTLTPYGRTRLAARLDRYRLAARRRVAPNGGLGGPIGNQNAPIDDDRQRAVSGRSAACR